MTTSDLLSAFPTTPRTNGQVDPDTTTLHDLATTVTITDLVDFLFQVAIAMGVVGIALTILTALFSYFLGKR